jgi:hypothetical protein
MLVFSVWFVVRMASWPHWHSTISKFVISDDIVDGSEAPFILIDIIQPDIDAPASSSLHFLFVADDLICLIQACLFFGFSVQVCTGFWRTRG